MMIPLTALSFIFNSKFDMLRFILKIITYGFLVLVALEVLVRIFHLYTEDPPRFIDKAGVEKRVPGHEGYAVTGNRNQNFSKFEINSSGFNSNREFLPTKDKFEIALVGDSYIEGFHQDNNNSIGVMTESLLDTVEVYEYGYAGYDFANQLHLINTYEEKFKDIDEIIIYLKFDNDLERARYEPNFNRIELFSTPIFKLRDNLKLFAYLSKIGILEPFRTAYEYNYGMPKIVSADKNGTGAKQKQIGKSYIDNFDKLIKEYGFDKTKTTILLDSRITDKSFLEHLKNLRINYIDFAPTFEAYSGKTTLVYDFHWNKKGRELIAKTIDEYIDAKYNDSK